MTPDQRHMERVASLGCVVCRNEGLGDTPALVHHVLTNGRRSSHRRVLPLCFNHHQSGHNDALSVSVHPWTREFERRYGTQVALLEQVARELKQNKVAGYA